MSLLPTSAMELFLHDDLTVSRKLKVSIGVGDYTGFFFNYVDSNNFHCVYRTTGSWYFEAYVGGVRVEQQTPSVLGSTEYAHFGVPVDLFIDDEAQQVTLKFHASHPFHRYWDSNGYFGTPPNLYSYVITYTTPFSLLNKGWGVILYNNYSASFVSFLEVASVEFDTSAAFATLDITAETNITGYNATQLASLDWTGTNGIVCETSITGSYDESDLVPIEVLDYRVETLSDNTPSNNTAITAQSTVWGVETNYIPDADKEFIGIRFRLKNTHATKNIPYPKLTLTATKYTSLEDSGSSHDLSSPDDLCSNAFVYEETGGLGKWGSCYFNVNRALSYRINSVTGATNMDVVGIDNDGLAATSYVYRYAPNSAAGTLIYQFDYSSTYRPVISSPPLAGTRYTDYAGFAYDKWNDTLYYAVMFQEPASPFRIYTYLYKYVGRSDTWTLVSNFPTSLTEITDYTNASKVARVMCPRANTLVVWTYSNLISNGPIDYMVASNDAFSSTYTDLTSAFTNGPATWLYDQNGNLWRNPYTFNDHTTEEQDIYYFSPGTAYSGSCVAVCGLDLDTMSFVTWGAGDTVLQRGHNFTSVTYVLFNGGFLLCHNMSAVSIDYYYTVLDISTGEMFLRLARNSPAIYSSLGSPQWYPLYPYHGGVDLQTGGHIGLTSPIKFYRDVNDDLVVHFLLPTDAKCPLFINSSITSGLDMDTYWGMEAEYFLIYDNSNAFTGETVTGMSNWALVVDQGWVSNGIITYVPVSDRYLASPEFGFYYDETTNVLITAVSAYTQWTTALFVHNINYSSPQTEDTVLNNVLATSPYYTTNNITTTDVYPPENPGANPRASSISAFNGDLHNSPPPKFSRLTLNLDSWPAGEETEVLFVLSGLNIDHNSFYTFELSHYEGTINIPGFYKAADIYGGYAAARLYNSYTYTPITSYAGTYTNWDSPTTFQYGYTYVANNTSTYSCAFANLRDQPSINKTSYAKLSMHANPIRATQYTSLWAVRLQANNVLLDEHKENPNTFASYNIFPPKAVQGIVPPNWTDLMMTTELRYGWSTTTYTYGRNFIYEQNVAVKDCFARNVSYRNGNVINYSDPITIMLNITGARLPCKADINVTATLAAIVYGAVDWTDTNGGVCEISPTGSYEAGTTHSGQTLRQCYCNTNVVGDYAGLAVDAFFNRPIVCGLSAKPDNSNIKVIAYRFRLDDGDESTASWLAPLNVSPQLEPDVTYRIRFAIRNEDQVNARYINNTWLDYNYNGGIWKAASTRVHAVYSPRYTWSDYITIALPTGSFTQPDKLDSIYATEINNGATMMVWGTYMDTQGNHDFYVTSSNNGGSSWYGTFKYQATGAVSSDSMSMLNSYGYGDSFNTDNRAIGGTVYYSQNSTSYKLMTQAISSNAGVSWATETRAWTPHYIDYGSAGGFSQIEEFYDPTYSGSNSDRVNWMVAYAYNDNFDRAIVTSSNDTGWQDYLNTHEKYSYYSGSLEGLHKYGNFRISTEDAKFYFWGLEQKNDYYMHVKLWSENADIRYPTDEQQYNYLGTYNYNIEFVNQNYGNDTVYGVLSKPASGDSLNVIGLQAMNHRYQTMWINYIQSTGSTPSYWTGSSSHGEITPDLQFYATTTNKHPFTLYNNQISCYAKYNRLMHGGWPVHPMGYYLTKDSADGGWATDRVHVTYSDDDNYRMMFGIPNLGTGAFTQTLKTIINDETYQDPMDGDIGYGYYSTTQQISSGYSGTFDASQSFVSCDTTGPAQQMLIQPNGIIEVEFAFRVKAVGADYYSDTTYGGEIVAKYVPIGLYPHIFGYEADYQKRLPLYEYQPYFEIGDARVSLSCTTTINPLAATDSANVLLECICRIGFKHYGAVAFNTEGSLSVSGVRIFYAKTTRPAISGTVLKANVIRSVATDLSIALGLDPKATNESRAATLLEVIGSFSPTGDRFSARKVTLNCVGSIAPFAGVLRPATVDLICTAFATDRGHIGWKGEVLGEGIDLNIYQCPRTADVVQNAPLRLVQNVPELTAIRTQNSVKISQKRLELDIIGMCKAS